MLALLAARLSVGLKVALRVRPVPASKLRVPPTVATLPMTKALPGSSLKLKVMRAVSPFLTTVLLLVIDKVGTKVSILISGVLPARPSLPAASVYRPLATVITPLPEGRSAVGVKRAVRVKPAPSNSLKLPPNVDTSASAKLLPGSSLKPKVITAVSPALSIVLLLVIDSVGACVSTLMADDLLARPALPAASS